MDHTSESPRPEQTPLSPFPSVPSLLAAARPARFFTLPLEVVQFLSVVFSEGCDVTPSDFAFCIQYFAFCTAVGWPPQMEGGARRSIQNTECKMQDAKSFRDEGF